MYLKYTQHCKCPLQFLRALYFLTTVNLNESAGHPNPKRCRIRRLDKMLQVDATTPSLVTGHSQNKGVKGLLTVNHSMEAITRKGKIREEILQRTK